ncbi:NirD/YgiW/YdeI family stress tolerance protein [Chitinophaga defluvii]|uniref:NirD/YgiW/YdeI family stress tolerance protein n=1 Tax=Chitinophaga defluvii TaxID=3163343 RepID=A0ABV2T3R2_9BACT
MTRLYLLVTLLLFTCCGYAQDKSPGEAPKWYTVGEAIRYARQLDTDGTIVKVKGYVMKKLDKETYLFTDRTAEIKVVIADKFLPALPFNEKDEVVLSARVNYEMNKPAMLEAKEKIEL